MWVFGARSRTGRHRAPARPLRPPSLPRAANTASSPFARSRHLAALVQAGGERGARPRRAERRGAVGRLGPGGAGSARRSRRPGSRRACRAAVAEGPRDAVAGSPDFPPRRALRRSAPRRQGGGRGLVAAHTSAVGAPTGSPVGATFSGWSSETDGPRRAGGLAARGALRERATIAARPAAGRRHVRVRPRGSVAPKAAPNGAARTIARAFRAAASGLVGRAPSRRRHERGPGRQASEPVAPRAPSRAAASSTSSVSAPKAGGARR